MNEAGGILAGTRWRHTTRHRWLVNGSLGFLKNSTSSTTLGKTPTCARWCWSSRFWHSDWKSGLFPDFYRKYSKVRTFPGPGRPCFKISTFPGNKDRVGTMIHRAAWSQLKCFEIVQTMWKHNGNTPNSEAPITKEIIQILKIHCQRYWSIQSFFHLVEKYNETIWLLDQHAEGGTVF